MSTMFRKAFHAKSFHAKSFQACRSKPAVPSSAAPSPDSIAARAASAAERNRKTRRCRCHRRVRRPQHYVEVRELTNVELRRLFRRAGFPSRWMTADRSQVKNRQQFHGAGGGDRTRTGKPVIPRLLLVGAGDGNRTRKSLRTKDFKSFAFTSFATPASHPVGNHYKVPPTGFRGFPTRLLASGPSCPQVGSGQNPPPLQAMPCPCRLRT